ncbi:MAG: hypothetical protein WAW96_15035 [Alphaproteobacteria bacterium]
MSQSLPQPEPGLTSQQLIERARALQPLLRAQQDENDARGCYSDEIHKRLLEGGLYRVLQPRRFGGYECDLKTFIQCIMEISRGHSGAGWCYALAASHSYVLACHWPEEAQVDIFGSDGDYRSGMVIGNGTLKRTNGGYIINGVWPFASGTPVSNHFMGSGLIMRDGAPPQTALFVVPRDKIKILRDWGGARGMGMQASGSNSVELKDVFVPELHVVVKPIENVMMASEEGGSPGARLHKNPMYLGILQGWFATEFGAILSGTARAALDEYEGLMKSKVQTFDPTSKRSHDPNQQRAMGDAMNLVDAAELLTLANVDFVSDLHRRWARDGTPITQAETLRAAGVARQACRMACDAVELLFHTAGAGVVKEGQRLGRYFRDVQMIRVHVQSSPRWAIMRAAGQLGIGPQGAHF